MPDNRSKTIRLLPPAKYLHQALDYDPDSGVLRWKKRRPIWHFNDEHAWKVWNANFAGKVAGGISHNGYLAVRINCQTYKCHRLIWKLMERAEPLATIDHIDGNPANNRWKNLRAATHQQQTWNADLRKDSSSGFKGVRRHRSRWVARIKINGVDCHRGCFDTPEEAALAYQAAAREAHGEFYRPPQTNTEGV